MDIKFQACYIPNSMKIYTNDSDTDTWDEPLIVKTQLQSQSNATISIPIEGYFHKTYIFFFLFVCKKFWVLFVGICMLFVYSEKKVKKYKINYGICD